MKHKHAEVIKSFVDGIECEYYGEGSLGLWYLITNLSQFNNVNKVRIKPEPEQEPQYLYVYRHIDTWEKLMSTTLMQDTSDWDYIGKVRLEK